jgi:hypothetical protein
MPTAQPRSCLPARRQPRRWTMWVRPRPRCPSRPTTSAEGPCRKLRAAAQRSRLQPTRRSLPRAALSHPLSKRSSPGRARRENQRRCRSELCRQSPQAAATEKRPHHLSWAPLAQPRPRPATTCQRSARRRMPPASAPPRPSRKTSRSRRAAQSAPQGSTTHQAEEALRAGRLCPAAARLQAARRSPGQPRPAKEPRPGSRSVRRSRPHLQSRPASPAPVEAPRVPRLRQPAPACRPRSEPATREKTAPPTPRGWTPRGPELQASQIHLQPVPGRLSQQCLSRPLSGRSSKVSSGRSRRLPPSLDHARCAHLFSD